MEITRKMIRDFMEVKMRKRLFYCSEFSRREICELFQSFLWRDLWADEEECQIFRDKECEEKFHALKMEFKDKVNFIEMLFNVLGKINCIRNNRQINQDTGKNEHAIFFRLDPAFPEEWERAMNAIYQEADHEN